MEIAGLREDIAAEAAKGTKADQDAIAILQDRIKSEKEIPYILDKAFQISTTGRPGPVLIDIPMNLLSVR